MPKGPKIDREALRGTIVEVTRQLIVKEGIEHLSARKIASEIGCAVGTIYNIFVNLDAIILAINGSTLTNLHLKLQAVIKPDQEAVEAILALGRAYVNFSRSNFHLWSVLIEFKLPPGSVVPDWLQAKIDDLFLLVSNLVLPLVESRHEADRAAKVLWAGLHGVCSLSVSGKLNTVKAESADILADSLIRNYLTGLQSKKRQASEVQL